MTPFSQVLCSVPYNTEIGMLVTFYPHLKAQPGKGPSLNSLALQSPSLQQQVKGAHHPAGYAENLLEAILKSLPWALLHLINGDTSIALNISYTEFTDISFHDQRHFSSKNKQKTLLWYCDYLVSLGNLYFNDYPSETLHLQTSITVVPVFLQ